MHEPAREPRSERRQVHHLRVQRRLGSLYGSIGLYPATFHPNATREIWDWDDSVFLGVIPEAAETFNVVGNANEHGMVMGETTFGGLPELDSHGTGGIRTTVTSSG